MLRSPEKLYNALLASFHLYLAKLLRKKKEIITILIHLSNISPGLNDTNAVE